MSSQSDSGSSEPVMSSEPEVHAGVTNLSVSDDLMASESSVVLVLEPLVLEDSQSEINSQSEIIKSHNIPESSQSEFLNIVTVQSEFKQTLDIVVTGH